MAGFQESKKIRLTNNFGNRKNGKTIEKGVVLIFQINSFSFTGKSRVLEY
jgi:hypothetical protein